MLKAMFVVVISLGAASVMLSTAEAMVVLTCKAIIEMRNGYSGYLDDTDCLEQASSQLQPR